MSRFVNRVSRTMILAALGGAVGVLAVPATVPAYAQDGRPEKKPDFPPFEKVSDGYKEVNSSAADNPRTLWKLWKHPKKGGLLAELPNGWDKHKYYIAVTQAGGSIFAGLQGPARYVYLKRFDDRIAVMQPELDTRSTGEPQSKSSVNRLFTDRVLLDIPIVAMGPSGKPVINLKSMLVDKGTQLAGGGRRFFGGGAAGGPNTRLARLKKVKAFPKNLEIAFEMPSGSGQLMTNHFSISKMEKGKGYKPRQADIRVGYFMTTFRDLGKYQEDEKWTRYIHRWHLEKRDPKLSLSPPKQPIVFYLEHTVPVRYRRWVRQGVEYWNEAYRAIGIDDAIEVYYQDKETGAHMEKDAEDVRYNFIRWLNNDISTAIGPSRAHPETGQIVDADIVLTDGWIRAYWRWYNEDMPKSAVAGMGPEALLYFEENPQWDPRLSLASPVDRERIKVERQYRRELIARGEAEFSVDPVLGDDEYLHALTDWLHHHHQLCQVAEEMAFDMAFASLAIETINLHAMAGDENGGKDGDEGKKDDTQLLDGIPEWFIGPMLAELTCHEVGHTIGLRHNFKASSIYTMDEINSEEWKGNKAMAGSVMDYLPANFDYDALVEQKGAQGDYTMIKVGPYDMWAIEYGYGFGDPQKVAARAGEPELAFLTDDDRGGPDPYARVYDLGKDPWNYAENQMKVARFHRDRILDTFVKDGESWSEARRGYEVTLNQQFRMISMMANWIGGAHVHRVFKGGNLDGAPIEVVDHDTQRKAVKFVIDNAFKDEAFGLTPELLLHMTVDKWSDQSQGDRGEPTWPVHDRIRGIQTAAMSMVMNPTTLKRIYDNEFRTPSDQDALTLPELLNTMHDSVFTELDTKLNGKTFTNRRPMVSTFRQSLQSEMVDRLVALSLDDSTFMPRPMKTLALDHLRRLDKKLKGILDKSGSGQVDDYTSAHLRELKERIETALEAVRTID